MRLVVDFQAAQSASRLRGIGRYSKALVKAIIDLGREHEVIICLNDEFEETVVPIRDEFELLVGPENIRVWKAPGPLQGSSDENDRRRGSAEVIYETFILHQEPDVVLITSLFEGYGDGAVTCINTMSEHVPVAVILYDLIPLHQPEAYLKPVPKWEKMYNERLKQFKNVDLFLAISGFTASDAKQRLSLDPYRVVNISGACADAFKPSAMAADKKSAMRSNLGIDRPYILTSGTVEPHKNLRLLFSAFTSLPRDLKKNYAIVLIGHSNDAQRTALRSIAETVGLDANALLFTGYIDDDDLVALYTDAELMVFPSLDEGFGLPVLEAMACGAPVLAANSSSLPEIVNMPEALFDPLDPKALARLMSKALTDAEFRNRLRQNGLKQSKKFSWSQTAMLALDSLENLCHPHTAANTRKVLDPDTLEYNIIRVLRDKQLNLKERIEVSQALAFSFPCSLHQKTLFVDVSHLRQHDSKTGIQRVTRSILLAWLKNPPPDYRIIPVFSTPTSRGYYYASEFYGRLTGTTADIGEGPIEYCNGDIFFGLDLGLDIVPFQRRELLKMRRAGVKAYFMIYDLLPVQLPHYFSEELQVLFEPWLEALLDFDGIVGISQATVDAFVDWQRTRGLTPVGRFTYDYAHLGADIENTLPTVGIPENGSEVIGLIRKTPSFLMVGTLEPRKGHAQTLDAFELLWKKDFDANLVIVGKNGWKVGSLAERIRRHPQLNRQLFWLEGVSDEYLRNIYSSCACLIAASEGEGFGLPLIEAAQAGLPIIARNLPVFREVGGASVTYFYSNSATELADCIQTWMNNYTDGEVIQSTDMKWSTWDDCASQIAGIVTRGSYKSSGELRPERNGGIAG